MRLAIGAGVMGAALLLSGCGGSGTTGTNYSEAPPNATILVTSTPKAEQGVIMGDPANEVLSEFPSEPDTGNVANGN